MNLFNQTNAVGKIGERQVKKYYRECGCDVLDVSNDEYYQQQDIDLFINDQAVEVKTVTNLDRYRTLCVELISNDSPEYCKAGWFLTSTADIVIYYSTTENCMYQIFLDDLRKLFYRHNYKQKRLVFNEFGDIEKASIVAFIPIEDIEKELIRYRKVQM